VEAIVQIAGSIPIAAEEGGGSFLVSPNLGLMIWTLVAFGVTLWVLSRAALPRIGEALEKRANAIRESIDAAEQRKRESDELLEEYRERLSEAREQADDIMARARKALSPEDQRRLVEEALSEVDFTSLSGSEN
jgi:F-type H+-transporting ATPase subunit b